MQISIVEYKIFMVLEILHGVHRLRAFRAGRRQSRAVGGLTVDAGDHRHRVMKPLPSEPF